MLRNDLNNCDFTSIKEIEELSSVKIARCNDLVHDMEKEVYKYTKLLELAKQDRLETIFHEVFYNDFDFCFDNPDITMDKLKNNSDESYLKHTIEKTIGFIIGYDENEISITKTMFEGYDCYNLSIYFTVADYPITFELRIPNMKQIKEHFKNMNYGKMLLMYESKPSTWDFIYDSYNEKEFKDAFRKFLNNKMGEL